jgi:hypothetical protein
MAAGGKRSTYGSQVKYADDAAGTTNPITLTQVAKLKPPKMTRRPVDGTHLESTDGYTEAAIPGLGWKESDPYSFDAWFTDAQVAALVALFEAGTEKYWWALLPLASGQTTKPMLTGPGIVSSYEIQEIDKGADEPIRCTFEVTRTSGKWTFTAGT